MPMISKISDEKLKTTVITSTNENNTDKVNSMR